MSRLCDDIASSYSNPATYDVFFNKQDQALLVKKENEKRAQEQMLPCSKPVIGVFF